MQRSNKDWIHLISKLISREHTLSKKLFFLLRPVAPREISGSEVKVTRGNMTSK
jgi:hypothetical protein